MRGALRPLVRLDRAAAEIGRSGDARRRLPDPQRQDEVGRLATTLNTMLGGSTGPRRRAPVSRRRVSRAANALDRPARKRGASRASRRDPRAGRRPGGGCGAARPARGRSARPLPRRSRAAPGRGSLTRRPRPGPSPPRALQSTPSPSSLRGDRAALERALGNLIENARRHGRGAVTVTVAGHDGLARLECRGRGTGHSRADRERAFERFYGRGLRARAGDRPGHGRAPRRPRLCRGSRVTIELVRKASESVGDPSREDSEKGLP